MTLWVHAADGVEIAVHELGGEGVPLVLAHATGFHGLVWSALATCLADGFRCVSYDARSHGDSGRSPDARQGLAWTSLALDALAVIEGLGLERPLAVGHSSGATALLLAEIARPGSFGSIYCYEPVIVPADPPLGRDPDSWLADVARRRRPEFGSRDEAFAAYAEKACFGSLREQVLRDYVDHGFADTTEGTVELKCHPEDEAVLYEMASAHDCFSRLEEIACPVTVVCGGETEGQGPGVLEQSVARLRQGRLEVLEGLGHLGPLEDPDAVAASVRRAFAPDLAGFSR